MRCAWRCCSPSLAASRCPARTRWPPASRFRARSCGTSRSWPPHRKPAGGGRAGRPVRIGAVTDQPDAWLSAIANGYGIALAPESASRFYARPGVTYRPVTGIAPSEVGVAWTPAAEDSHAVRDFIRCCLARFHRGIRRASPG
jgi:DNA-binding transcriptional LysR family regulator